MRFAELGRHSGRPTATWFNQAGADPCGPFEVPEGAAVTVSISGKGALMASKNGVDYKPALDTGGNPIAGSVGAAHVASGYRYLRPDGLEGKCDLTVSLPE